MLEPELQNYLSGINQNLTEIKNKKHIGVWRSFFNGMFAAFGYFVGLAIIIAVVGFIAQKTGILKDIQTQAKDFQLFLDQAKKVIGAGDSAQNSAQNLKTGSVITLPDGRKVQIVE
jgi:hypothetical protein